MIATKYKDGTKPTKRTRSIRREVASFYIKCEEISLPDFSYMPPTILLQKSPNAITYAHIGYPLSEANQPPSYIPPNPSFLISQRASRILIRHPEHNLLIRRRKHIIPRIPRNDSRITLMFQLISRPQMLVRIRTRKRIPDQNISTSTP